LTVGCPVVVSPLPREWSCLHRRRFPANSFLKFAIFFRPKRPNLPCPDTWRPLPSIGIFAGWPAAVLAPAPVLREPGRFAWEGRAERLASAAIHSSRRALKAAPSQRFRPRRLHPVQTHSISSRRPAKGAPECPVPGSLRG